MILRWRQCDGHSGPCGAPMILVSLSLVALLPSPAFGLLTGGTGNEPLSVSGLPEGALAILNNPARIAYWEGPPIGGGEWHGEYRGDTRTFNAVLAKFAEMKAKHKRVIVHDGVGRSFWLNPNRELAKQSDAQIDWTFMVWQDDNWERLREMPPELRPASRDGPDSAPPSEIEVYTGANIRWADVVVPKGIELVDNRLEAHGHTLADGHVLEGRVTDLRTGRPISAQVHLERIETPPEGGYKYSRAAHTRADAQGHWVLKKIPVGWYRLTVTGDGYVPRVAGYTRPTDQPRWQSFDCQLARPATVSGRVTDDAGKPLPDVEVRLADVTAAGVNEHYRSPEDYTARSDSDGRFRLEQVPVGKATVRVRKSGYFRAGLGLPITTPAKDVTLNMSKSAGLRVTVDFAGKQRPEVYIVELEPEGGAMVGSWGGSAEINTNNQFLFENVPPGRYVLKGHPNPSAANQHTDPVTVELTGSQTKEITLPAK